MKFGIREICDVVLKAKANQKVGNKIFYKDEPVCYFDTLKTSTMEGTVSTVYATGGRGNSRLMSWDGERTVTFTMEDALISPEGLMILTGAGLIEGSSTKKLPVHVVEQSDALYTSDSSTKGYVIVDQVLSDDAHATIYVMYMKNGEIVSEPYIGTKMGASDADSITFDNDNEGTDIKKAMQAAAKAGKAIKIDAILEEEESGVKAYTPTLGDYAKCEVATIDYYTDKGDGCFQVDITPDKFGGSYYLEASTLFRDSNGVDMPAEFVIPNCRVQSNFNFSMASTGDPSTFTFTMDAFPDYTKFNKTEKVFASIQVINEAQAEDVYRSKTVHDPEHDKVVK